MTWSMTLSTVTSSCSTPLLRPRASTDGALVNIAYKNWWQRSCPSLARSLPEAKYAGCQPSSAWDQRWRIWGGDQEVPDRSGWGSQEVATQVRQQPVPGEAWASGFRRSTACHRHRGLGQPTTSEHWCPVCKTENGASYPTGCCEARREICKDHKGWHGGNAQ